MNVETISAGVRGGLRFIRPHRVLMTKQTGHDLLTTRLRKPRHFGFRLIWYRLAALLAILGPGFITANVDNDPGGILTYSQAGAKYGYALLWTLVPTTIALIVVQEMAARMAVATGKGLSDLIREEFGLRMTFFTMTYQTSAAPSGTAMYLPTPKMPMPEAIPANSAIMFPRSASA